jgi:hypothetical protein
MKNKLWTLSLALMAFLLVVGCHKKGDQNEGTQSNENKKWEWSQAEQEYEQIQAELRLARTAKPYLVLDFRKREIEIRLKGTEVWNFPMQTIDGDYGSLVDFSQRFQGKENLLIRPILEKHLFASSGKTSDSILAIVGKAVNVDPQLLQRQVPQRFQILWDNNLIIDIRTDVAGKAESRFKNTIAEVRHALRRPFGESILTLKMDPEQALTLYRASDSGLPTFIIPAP